MLGDAAAASGTLVPTAGQHWSRVTGVTAPSSSYPPKYATGMQCPAYVEVPAAVTSAGFTKPAATSQTENPVVVSTLHPGLSDQRSAAVQYGVASVVASHVRVGQHSSYNAP